MTSTEVREALSFGIDPTRIKVALKKKWEETGSGKNTRLVKTTEIDREDFACLDL